MEQTVADLIDSAQRISPVVMINVFTKAVCLGFSDSTFTKYVDNSHLHRWTCTASKNKVDSHNVKVHILLNSISQGTDKTWHFTVLWDRNCFDQNVIKDIRYWLSFTGVKIDSVTPYSREIISKRELHEPKCLITRNFFLRQALFHKLN